MDLDIRHVPVDKLTTLQDRALAGRRGRLVELLAEYKTLVETLQSDLEEAQKNYAFLQTEHENVVLAEKLASGLLVRVKCPACNGTGMKPANVISGQVSKGSAFESTGKAPVTPTTPVIDEINRCTECKGQRWVIMERFRG
jgi:DnaJ-class molecular chaperone